MQPSLTLPARPTLLLTRRIRTEAEILLPGPQNRRLRAAFGEDLRFCAVPRR
jgi:hypothetical protein